MHDTVCYLHYADKINNFLSFLSSCPSLANQVMATCRRTMIAEALGEHGGQGVGVGICARGCDVCSGAFEGATTIDATAYALTLVRSGSEHKRVFAQYTEVQASDTPTPTDFSQAPPFCTAFSSSGKSSHVFLPPLKRPPAGTYRLTLLLVETKVDLTTQLENGHAVVGAVNVHGMAPHRTAPATASKRTRRT